MENSSLPDQSQSPRHIVRLDTLVQWSCRPVSAMVGPEIVLMNLDRGRCYGLGPTGTDLWQKMETPVVVKALLAQLQGEYDVTMQQLEDDVLPVLQQYADEGLIDVSLPTQASAED